jgi:histone-lysine N-methyltransferase SETMAR
MAGLAETWSNIEVRSMIRFLRLKSTSAEIHRKLAVQIRRERPGLLRRGVLLHDNARPHSRELWRYNWEVLDHPPYSPDLARSDFHLFGPLKHLGGRRFATDGEVQQAVMSWLQALDTDFFYAGIDALVYRWDKCFG